MTHKTLMKLLGGESLVLRRYMIYFTTTNIFLVDPPILVFAGSGPKCPSHNWALLPKTGHLQPV